MTLPPKPQAPNTSADRSETDARTALDIAVGHLLSLQRGDAGFWPGRLCSSPLATSTAVSALAMATPVTSKDLRRRALEWLVRHQNHDGSWGDAPGIPGNLAASILGLAAFRLSNDALPQNAAAALEQVEGYLATTAGKTPTAWREALAAYYGEDRTFAVPIQMNAALANLFDWRTIPRLPFELAAFPRFMYRLLRLQVVSYALPALIAIGLLIHRRNPSRVPVLRWLRDLATPRVLRRLTRVQPESGGYLEAIPLTAFVAMSLSACGHTDDQAVRRAVDFLLNSSRADGSWPIDVELSAWVTSLSIQALSTVPGMDLRDASLWATTRTWIEKAQHTERHPFTGAAPGGWAWSPLSGGVPDADDTAGALLALCLLGAPRNARAIRQGVHWLLDLQNSDGGWPTFCRGWSHLPFDRSTPDITAHVLRALQLTGDTVPDTSRIRRARHRACTYLARHREPDGSWRPLWFGNPYVSDGANPVYGTASVLRAVLEIDVCSDIDPAPSIRFLLSAQNSDGGWGGASGVPSSIEETGCALTALRSRVAVPTVRHACERGTTWLVRQIFDGAWCTPAPIGLYFAGLRYTEDLYPVLWTVCGLGSMVSAGVKSGG